ncbi:hypothetical protein WA158_003209 [Blastocystis sp. Blastoise]
MEIEGLAPRKFHTMKVGKNLFTIDTRYQIQRAIGSGSYGVVCAAEDTKEHRLVAIKKITDIFQDLVDAKRILREVKLLRHLEGASNIMKLYDVVAMPYGQKDFRDLYIITQLFECDLNRIILSPQPLTDDHNQYFLYQILRSLKCLHQANVLHRDLKPSNILVNSNCDLALCDFGLARGLETETKQMTEYVVTRWYRAPELLCENTSYDSAVDMWSVGCIFGELLGRQPLLQGRSPMHQLRLIIRLLGPQSDDDLQFIQKPSARDIVKSLDFGPPIDLHVRYPGATDAALDLLSRLLTFNPKKRITIDEAMTHPYLSHVHESMGQIPKIDVFNPDFEKKWGPVIPREELQKLFIDECLFYPQDEESSDNRGEQSNN